MSDTIYTQHPDPSKQGVNINKAKYDVIHDEIVGFLGVAGPSSLSEITRAVSDRIGDSFEGSIGWYVTTVKLDMESRGELTCDRSKSPHAHSLS